MKQPKVFSLFPTPLYANTFEGDTSEVVEYFDTIEMDNPNPPYGVLSKNSYVLDNPICENLTKWIKKCFTDFATHVMRYDFQEISLSQSWLTFKEPGQFHKAHTHPNSLLGGVFYYDHEPGDASIVFSKEIGSINRPYIEPKLLPDFQEHLYSQEEIYFTPEKNTLIIFPSYLTHGVPPNNTNKTRKALGVNAITKGTLGDINSISEIKYSRHA